MRGLPVFGRAALDLSRVRGCVFPLGVAGTAGIVAFFDRAVTSLATVGPRLVLVRDPALDARDGAPGRLAARGIERAQIVEVLPFATGPESPARKRHVDATVAAPDREPGQLHALERRVRIEPHLGLG